MTLAGRQSPARSEPDPNQLSQSPFAESLNLLTSEVRARKQTNKSCLRQRTNTILSSDLQLDEDNGKVLHFYSNRGWVRLCDFEILASIFRLRH